MKAIKCKLIGNTAWGYCFTPEVCNSMREAQRKGRENVEEGYWFDYRIIKIKAA